MNYSPGYVLVIGQSAHNLTDRLPDNFQGNLRGSLQSVAADPNALSQSLHCPVVVTDSAEQAVAKAQEHHPHLVILSGNASKDWSPQIVQAIRQSVQPEEVVIVSLSKSSEFSWMPESSSSEIDGFFVEPLSVDVLSALNQSAIAKKECLQLAGSSC